MCAVFFSGHLPFNSLPSKKKMPRKSYFVFFLFCLLNYVKFSENLLHPDLYEDDSCCQEERFVGGPLDTEAAVEFRDYLLEIQLHDPTVKVLPAPIINHRKQRNYWHCTTYSYCSTHACKV